jgi:hypothetical protein
MVVVVVVVVEVLFFFLVADSDVGWLVGWLVCCGTAVSTDGNRRHESVCAEDLSLTVVGVGVGVEGEVCEE